MMDVWHFEGCTRPGCDYHASGPDAEEVRADMDIHVRYEHRAERWRALRYGPNASLRKELEG